MGNLDMLKMLFEMVATTVYCSSTRMGDREVLISNTGVSSTFNF